MSLDLLLRRVLLYRLLRYRAAWFVCAAIGGYLTLSLVLALSARHQVALRGPIATCEPGIDSGGAVVSYTFTLSGSPARTLFLQPDSLSPALPPDFCNADVVSVSYENGTVGGPYLVDRVTLRNPLGRATTPYATPAGRDFATAKRLSLLVFGGGMGVISLAMLLVGIFWRHAGVLLRKKEPRQSPTRDAPSPLPSEFLDQVAEDLRWLAALPWGQQSLAASPGDAAVAYARFHRGIALLRGWGGDQQRLLDGVELLVHCPPALAWTGAAEAALQLANYDVVTWAPDGPRAALRFSELALAASREVVEAHLARIQALAALASMGESAALRQAELALGEVRAPAPDHPRLPAAEAAVHVARRHWAPAISALRRAIERAPSQEEVQALLEQLAQALYRSGDLRQALRLFVLLNTPRNGSATGASMRGSAVRSPGISTSGS